MNKAFLNSLEGKAHGDSNALISASTKVRGKDRGFPAISSCPLLTSYFSYKWLWSSG